MEMERIDVEKGKANDYGETEKTHSNSTSTSTSPLLLSSPEEVQPHSSSISTINNLMKTSSKEQGKKKKNKNNKMIGRMICFKILESTVGTLTSMLIVLGAVLIFILFLYYVVALPNIVVVGNLNGTLHTSLGSVGDALLYPDVQFKIGLLSEMSDPVPVNNHKIYTRRRCRRLNCRKSKYHHRGGHNNNRRIDTTVWTTSSEEEGLVKFPGRQNPPHPTFY